MTDALTSSYSQSRRAARLGPGVATLIRYMLVETENYKFELDNSWVNEAGFDPSVIEASHFEADADKCKGDKIFLINLSDINPKIRGEGVPIFNDGEVDGAVKTARERTVSILKAIMSNSTLPPVEVVHSNEKSFKFKLVHGSHRFHCSIAAGFVQIPAVFGFDITK